MLTNEGERYGNRCSWAMRQIPRSTERVSCILNGINLDNLLVILCLKLYVVRMHYILIFLSVFVCCVFILSVYIWWIKMCMYILKKLVIVQISLTGVVAHSVLVLIDPLSIVTVHRSKVSEISVAVLCISSRMDIVCYCFSDLCDWVCSVFVKFAMLMLWCTNCWRVWNWCSVTTEKFVNQLHHAVFLYNAVLQFAVCVFFIKMHTTLWSIHYIVRRSQNALH